MSDGQKKSIKAFTLIELMVVVSISLFMISSVAISLNKYYSREKVTQATNRIISLINLARSYAVTNQFPTGFSNIDYVSIVLKTNGKISAFPVNLSGTGPSYFSEKVGTGDIITTAITFGTLNFAVGSGKLVGKNDSSFLSYPLSSVYSIGITVTSGEISPDYHQITISPIQGVTDVFFDL